MSTNIAADSFAMLVSGSFSSSVSSLLTKISSHIKDLSLFSVLQHLQKGFPHISDLLGIKPETLKKNGTIVGSPLPKILGSSTKRSSSTASQRMDSTTTDQPCLTNAVLVSIFALYKYPTSPEVIAAKQALSTIDTITFLSKASTSSCNVFLLAQAIHLLLVDIIANHIAKGKAVVTTVTPMTTASLKTALSEGGHNKLQMDTEYDAIERCIVSNLRYFSSKANYDEVVIVLLNSLLRLQLLTFNYLSAYRSIMNYRVAILNTSHPQLIRFYLYSSLVVAIIGQHSRALKLISNANQLFMDYSSAIVTKTQISVDLAAFTSLFKLLTCTGSSIAQPFEDGYYDGMITKVSFPDIYAVLLTKRMARIKAQLAYLSRIFKRISLKEICRRINVSEDDARDCLISCAMENVFSVRFNDDENGECIVTIVQPHEQLLSTKTNFRAEALQLVGKLNAIRNDLTQKDVLLSRNNTKHDQVNNVDTYLDMLDLLDLGFSDTD